MEWLSDPQAWVALLTLTVLEIVLGIDNIVFLSILSGRLPERQRSSARRFGLVLAMGTRLGLLFTITWIMGLQKPWFPVFGHDVTGRDLILASGGLFLIWKSVTEIHEKLEGKGEGATLREGGKAAFVGTVLQIAILDIVFSLDSVITAVGMVNQLAVMVIAVVIAVLVMLFFINQVCRIIERHPTIKMLALSFLLLIGFTLIGEATGLVIPKGYVYFAMAFSVLVEALNLRMRRRGPPVRLND